MCEGFVVNEDRDCGWGSDLGLWLFGRCIEGGRGWTMKGVLVVRWLKRQRIGSLWVVRERKRVIGGRRRRRRLERRVWRSLREAMVCENGERWMVTSWGFTGK